MQISLKTGHRNYTQLKKSGSKTSCFDLTIPLGAKVNTLCFMQWIRRNCITLIFSFAWGKQCVNYLYG
jgi:hypothetical protein